MSQALPLRTKLGDGRAVTGLWAAVPSAFAVELMVMPGVDYVCVDQQHGVVDYADMVDMFRAVERMGSAPITRVPANESWLIARALDAGAHAVVVPMVSTGAEAAAAVAACRYPPTGVRSFGPIRSVLTLGTRDRSILGDGPLCLVMVETREGLDNLEAIADTPGLDGIYVGPADLALGLGLEPTLDAGQSEHAEAIARILSVCQDRGLVAGIQSSSGASARRQVEAGFTFVTFGKDSAILRDGVRNEIAIMRDTTGHEAEGYS